MMAAIWTKEVPSPAEPRGCAPRPRGSLLRRGVLTGRREACGCWFEYDCPECGGKGVVLVWTGISPEWMAAL
jgi:hypothetical protein